MMGNQMTNLSFLGGDLSPCSEGMGWGRHQVPDSAQPGRAVCTAGSARPHLLPGGPEGGLAAIGPAGVTLCIQGLAQAGAGRAPGATLRRAGGREQPRNCTSFRSDSRLLCGTDRSTGRAGRPTCAAAGCLVHVAFVCTLGDVPPGPAACRAHVECPHHFWTNPCHSRVCARPGCTGPSIPSWPVP